ncbi:hypothetical protein ACFWTE_11190 [Nocardiopsis sp. NPDC058631]
MLFIDSRRVGANVALVVVGRITRGSGGQVLEATRPDARTGRQVFVHEP